MKSYFDLIDNQNNLTNSIFKVFKWQVIIREFLFVPSKAANY